MVRRLNPLFSFGSRDCGQETEETKNFTEVFNRVTKCLEGKICRDPAYNGKITIWIFYANTIYVGLRTSLNQFRIKLHIEILRFSVLVKFMLLAPAKNIN